MKKRGTSFAGRLKVNYRIGTKLLKTTRSWIYISEN